MSQVLACTLERDSRGGESEKGRRMDVRVGVGGLSAAVTLLTVSPERLL